MRELCSRSASSGMSLRSHMLDLQLVYELKVSYTVDLDPDLCEVVMI